MPYLIDGHNLIGKIPGLSLQDIDDEKYLIEYLEPIFKRLRKKATVFFDRGNPLQKQKFGSAFLKVQFIKLPHTADEAIISNLKKQKGNAKNFTVVSSDHWVMEQTTKNGAKAITCEAFLASNHNALDESSNTEKPLNEDIEYWLDRFDEGS